MIDIDALRKVAEECGPDRRVYLDDSSRAYLAFRNMATPETIIELCDRVKALEEEPRKFAELWKERGRAEGMEEAAKIAEDFSWTLPMYTDRAINEASDDAACNVQDGIAVAIRAAIERKP